MNGNSEVGAELTGRLRYSAETSADIPCVGDWVLADAFTGRIGYNHGKNPITDEFVNYLWPAIVDDHYTVGFGYAFDRQSQINFGLSYVPEATVTGTGPLPPFGNGGMTIDHSQLNWQLMYSYTF